MSYTVSGRDTSGMVEAMLPDLKAHVNVTFDDDDPILRRYLNWAIGYLEADSGLIFAAVNVQWIPDATVRLASFPIVPVDQQSLVITDELLATVTDDYLMAARALTEPVFLTRKDGTPLGTIMVAFGSGYTDPANLPPIAEAYIFRVAATLYENRESISAVPSLDQIPSWMNDRLAGLWVPRA